MFLVVAGIVCCCYNWRKNRKRDADDTRMARESSIEAPGCLRLTFLPRQFNSLMWKNYLLKRRSLVQLLVEVLVPTLFVLLLVLIRSVITAEDIPEIIPTAGVSVPTYSEMIDIPKCPSLTQCNATAPTERKEDPMKGLNSTFYQFAGANKEMSKAEMISMMSSMGFNDKLSVGVAFGMLDTAPRDDKLTETEFEDASKTEQFQRYLQSALPSGTDIDFSAAYRKGEASTNTICSYKATAQQIARDPLKYCQLLKFAVLPNRTGDAALDEAVLTFLRYLHRATPSLDDRNQTMRFTGPEAFTNYVQHRDYGLPGLGFDPVGVAVVFNSGPPKWDYTIRANRTFETGQRPGRLTPSTRSLGSPLKRQATSRGGTSIRRNDQLGQYAMSGYIPVQVLVDSFIINRTLSNATGVDRGSGGWAAGGRGYRDASLGAAEMQHTFGGIGGGTDGGFDYPEVTLFDFPSPAYTTDGFWAAASNLFPILMIISCLYPVSGVVKSVVWEKETKIKEGMMMMGLRDTVHYSSWFVTYAIQFLITSVAVAIAGGSLFQYSSGFLIWIYYYLFFLASTSFCFCISVFFSRAKTSGTVGMMIFFAALMPYFSDAVSGEEATSTAQVMSCLLPPTAFALGSQAFSVFEDGGVGVTFATSNTAPSETFTFKFSTCLTMMFFDIFLYAGLAWYLQAVIPTEWGTTKSWYFVCSPKYWRQVFNGKRRRSVGAERESMVHKRASANQDEELAASELLQQEVEGRCIQTLGLRKVFGGSGEEDSGLSTRILEKVGVLEKGGGKVAVHGLNISMYEGQITALLGHNGAGKTTTISMLTGLLPVTSGDAQVLGLSVVHEMQMVRERLGVCPQHNILFPTLTVTEHLLLFGAFRGVSTQNLPGIALELVRAVGLTAKANSPSEVLSGGQKRKLSVAIALMGDSKVVFLDEPTSGMVSHARHGMT